eukprot:Pompholyxophrys_punicea_v1_NODE_215_length_2724_cov_21.246534.p3 type:complete len:107 gc:universal NODE_215_length_2724_cov_21.246534:2347-2667(+)
MDGAAIHLHPAMTQYFFERGIVIVFLPAYSPMYNPIEILFGLVKRRCRELYHEKGTEERILMQVLSEFRSGCFDASNLFRRCGYKFSGGFDFRVNEDLFFEEANAV